MTQHTSGPWIVSPGDKNTLIEPAYCFDISGKNWGGFARVVIRMDDEDEPSKEGLANARLIAAAPDLLEALKEVKEACLFDDDNRGIGVTEEPHIPTELFSKICAAIAKATGEA